MAKNYSEIAFSNASKLLQEQFGSRVNYARVEQNSLFKGLTENEIEFIAERDSFYLATVGENGYPYIQHRGGPKGFVKVLDNRRLGFIDFKGNMQYVSICNLATNDKVALFFMDYKQKTRLKMYAKAEIVDLSNDMELFKTLHLNDYKFRPERMMVLNIEAYDWNCPQHITPRYTVDEIELALEPQKEYIRKLETEIKLLSIKNNE